MSMCSRIQKWTTRQIPEAMKAKTKLELLITGTENNMRKISNRLELAGATTQYWQNHPAASRDQSLSARKQAQKQKIPQHKSNTEMADCDCALFPAF